MARTVSRFWCILKPSTIRGGCCGANYSRRLARANGCRSRSRLKRARPYANRHLERWKGKGEVIDQLETTSARVGSRVENGGKESGRAEQLNAREFRPPVRAFEKSGVLRLTTRDENRPGPLKLRHMTTTLNPCPPWDRNEWSKLNDRGRSHRLLPELLSNCACQSGSQILGWTCLCPNVWLEYKSEQFSSYY